MHVKRVALLGASAGVNRPRVSAGGQWRRASWRVCAEVEGGMAYRVNIGRGIASRDDDDEEGLCEEPASLPPETTIRNTGTHLPRRNRVLLLLPYEPLMFSFSSTPYLPSAALHETNVTQQATFRPS